MKTLFLSINYNPDHPKVGFMGGYLSVDCSVSREGETIKKSFSTGHFHIDWYDAHKWFFHAILKQGDTYGILHSSSVNHFLGDGAGQYVKSLYLGDSGGLNALLTLEYSEEGLELFAPLSYESTITMGEFKDLILEEKFLLYLDDKNHGYGEIKKLVTDNKHVVEAVIKNNLQPNHEFVTWDYALKIRHKQDGSKNASVILNSLLMSPLYQKLLELKNYILW